MVTATTETEVVSPLLRTVSSIRRSIEQGSMRSGMPLPSERALSKQLGVHRATVRRALDLLGTQGWVERTTPRTWTVIRHDTASSQDSFLSQAIVVLAPGGESVVPGHTRSGWAEFVSRGAVAAIRRHNRYAVSINTSGCSAETISQLVAQRPLGVVIADIVDQPATVRWVEQLAKGQIPAVIYGTNAAYSTCDRVASDHEAGAYDATRWMIQAGRRRIVNVWTVPANLYWHQARRRGYERAMDEAGLEPLPTIEIPRIAELSGVQEEDAEAAFRAAVRTTAGYLVEHLSGDSSIDAMLLATDHDYYYIAGACRLFGKVPGEDVLFGGYDNYYADCVERRFEMAAPSVTVDKLNELAGDQMVDLLLERIENRIDGPPVTRMLRPVIVETGVAAR